MSPLRELALTPGWIYETVVCTDVAGSPHASPAGVWTTDLRSLSMELYDTSRSLPALLAAGEFCVDLPADAGAFFLALYDPSALSFGRASVVSAPCLTDATATVEAHGRGGDAARRQDARHRRRAPGDDTRGGAPHQPRRRAAGREPHRRHPGRPALAGEHARAGHGERSCRGEGRSRLTLRNDAGQAAGRAGAGFIERHCGPRPWPGCCARGRWSRDLRARSPAGARRMLDSSREAWSSRTSP